LAHIHQQGIIHGDLHPNNILINKQFRLKIIDFDLATNVSNKTSRYGGIREFLAPELINQDDLIDFIGQKPNKRSEVYQIGILIYFTLYGKFPIDEATWKNHLIAMKNNTISFEKTNQYGQIIEDKYINLLKRCLYFEPKSRPSSALKALKILHF
jgi:eukaryotic-like serine/threonine-protein kinase